MELRPYQVKAIDAGLEYFNSKFNKPALEVLPCAAGKSIIIAELAKQCGSPVLCVQPSQELLLQNYRKSLAIGCTPSLYSASVNKRDITALTYATIGSLKGKAQEFINAGVQHVIIDEAHFKCPTKEGAVLNKFLKALKPKKILGLTATPVYPKTNSLGTRLCVLTRMQPKLFSKIIHVTQVQEMVENNWWSKLEYIGYPFDNSTLELNTTGAEYTEESIHLSVKVQGVNNRMYKRILEHLSNGVASILVFMDSVENAEKMASVIPFSACISAKTSKKERERIIAAYLCGEIKVLTNVSVLTTGFDYPELQVVMVGRPTNSFQLDQQMKGRGVRIHDNKTKCLIEDFCGNLERFGRLEDITIEDVEDYGWCIFSKDRLITGVPMGGMNVYRKDIKELSGKTEPINSESKIWFGKHKDKKLVDLPFEYIRWMLFESGFDFKTTQSRQLKKELLSIYELNAIEKP